MSHRKKMNYENSNVYGTTQPECFEFFESNQINFENVFKYILAQYNFRQWIKQQWKM